MSAIAIAIAVIAVGLLTHCLFSLHLMLYAWDVPGRLNAAGAPTRFVEPRIKFTALLPCRDEAHVIADTIERVWKADYPRDLLEIVIICQRDDPKTISAAERQIDALRGEGLKLVVYDESPFNKPHALTHGLAEATGEVIAVFDAEDDVHPELFSVINTVMLEQEAGVVQAGVQLMNVRDHWFAPFNCLEYFFYYRSRMLFNSRVGMVPLGGNTIFMRRSLIDRVGGWDVSCLTEDADIGVRISALGEPVTIVVDAPRVTREETPHSTRQFIRQRTRWHQGFLQILGRGDWRRIPGRASQVLAMATFAQPILDAVLMCYVILLPISLILLHLPSLVALLSTLPLYGVILQLTANLVALGMFGRCYEQRIPFRTRLAMPFTFLPFQWMIGISAIRALVRHGLGQGEWEKTEHLGAHRHLEVAPAPTLVKPGSKAPISETA